MYRVDSSMVEQYPFKVLVLGSSPSQPTPLLTGWKLVNSGFASDASHQFGIATKCILTHINA